MFDFLPALIASLIGSFLVDWLARPRALQLVRRFSATWLLFCITLVPFGFFLAVSGNTAFAAIFTLSLHLLFVLASNAKNRMLGEPLLFTDLALVGAMFRHPQFYFSVLAVWQKAAGLAALVVLFVLLSLLIRPTLPMAGAGLSMAGGGLALCSICVRLKPIRDLAQAPNIIADTRELGLAPTLLLYWLRWRECERLEPAAAENSNDGAAGDAAELIVVVQCESYADPAELFGDQGKALPQLEASRAAAVQWGDLQVSGFGAYTMRTEYGVLFGNAEDALGFRLYDPYLTALDDTHSALPNKLGVDRWSSLFVHPHDMRFYNRDQILPEAGFAQMVSEADFAPPAANDGRYVTDAAVAEKILDLAGSAEAPTFIYAVTIENHGPWAPHGDSGADHMVENYTSLVQAGDAMLGALRDGIAALGKPAILVFFGDHRPSIPGASMPGGARHTPYVMLQFDTAGQLVKGKNTNRDLTPAQLHHAILALNTGGPANHET